MTLDVFIPAISGEDVLNQCVWKLVENRVHKETLLFVIDNGSKRPIWEEGDRPATVIRNDSNVGMVESLQQAKRICDGDILMFMHSDFMVHERGWDDKILSAFKADPKLGLLGAVGGSVAATNGGRANVLCSFRDAHVHGTPTPHGVHPAVLLDGCCMIFRKSAMDGIPELNFPAHHFHDKMWSIQMVMNGYRVGVIKLDCDHLGGRTSCQPECQESFKKWGGEQAIYNSAERKYLEKWGPLFPMSVDANWNYSTRAGPLNV